MKIDKRKKYFMVLDTETCPIDRELEEVTPTNMLVYDIGYTITDKKGNVYRTGSYIVSDIFFGEFYTKMQSSYYANKIPKYMEQIANGERVVKTWKQISFILRKVLEEFDINVVVAHNARFDYGVLRNTKDYLEEYPMLPYVEWWDTLKMARSILKERKSYKRFCEDNNYMTKNNQCRFTAEVIYRYLTNDLEFEESHTGLEDTLIEKDILAFCIKQHKKMDKLLFNK
jgi:DNA polymerase III epsilon subunit-like protein